MDYLKSYRYWKSDLCFDEQTRAELAALDEEKDKKTIIDRFYKNLEFGTAGLRGVMAAGINCMNKYTVGRATTGLANYMLDTFGADVCKERGVAIAYDTRNNSEYFAGIVADVFSRKGIKVYLYEKTSPIPILSYGVRKLKTVIGIVITASHNPKQYNGYKVYDETGCQITSEMANAIAKRIDEITEYSVINFERDESLVEMVDLTDEFAELIVSLSRIQDKKVKENLKVVYTPIHGSGYIPVSKVLKLDGFTNLKIVEEQALPNGDFPTVSAPNPERRDALELGIKLAKETDSDIVLGTDPDTDRVGIAVKYNGDYSLITGNQIAALLIDYLIDKLDRKTTPKPMIIKTIVSSELGEMIARKHNVSMISVLTGFKYIGEKMNMFENAKKSGDKKYDYDYLLGYEESYGYLIGEHARDKDAVVTSMFLCEIAADMKSKGRSIIERLNELYEEYGYILDFQDNVWLDGKDGADRIASMMDILKTSASPFEDTVKIIDYNKGVLENEGFEVLPKSDVLKFILSDGSWVAVRPSGTEPKIKIYYSSRGNNEAEAKERLEELRLSIKTKLGI